MKKTILAVIVVVIAVIALWPRTKAPKPASTPVDEVQSPTPTTATPAVTHEASGKKEDLEERLAEEKAARKRAETESTERGEKLAVLKTNVVVSLGTVEDMGKRAGAILPALSELQELAGRDPKTLSPDEKRRLLELQRDHAQLLGELPEITHLQDTPDDYGKFFRSMLQQAAGLNDAQAGQVETYMRERGVAMNQLGLNAARQPAGLEQQEEWERRRDTFNEQTADGLRGLLPPGISANAGIGPGLMEFLEMDFDKLQGMLPMPTPPNVR